MNTNNEAALDFASKCYFSASGYLSSGICLTLFAGIHLWADFVGSSVLAVSVSFILLFILSAGLSLVLMHYLTKRISPREFFEHDILVCMIGMIFIALAINQAMLFVGIIITSGALAVFTFENIKRHIDALRRKDYTGLSGWISGPLLSLAVLLVFSDYALVVLRLLFAHFAIISFWYWIKRLDRHESFDELPKFLSHNGQK